jgi:rubrerythrin
MFAEVALVTETAAIPSSDPWLNMQPEGSSGYSYAASERLIRALEAYASAEARDLADCQDLVQRSDDPGVKLLLGLIIDDEQRHRALLESMVRRLQDDSQPDVAFAAQLDGTGIPVSDLELAAALRTLIRDEHEGARHLRHVGRQDATVYGGLYTLLLEAIARDSEKHATILRFLLKRFERKPA